MSAPPASANAHSVLTLRVVEALEIHGKAVDHYETGKTADAITLYKQAAAHLWRAEAEWLKHGHNEEGSGAATMLKTVRASALEWQQRAEALERVLKEQAAGPGARMVEDQAELTRLANQTRQEGGEREQRARRAEERMRQQQQQ